MLEPGTRIERYEVVHLIGEGGMARVYLVRHVTLETNHALKVLYLEGSRGLTERLIEEGRAQARLIHPNLVRVSDVLQVGDRPALILDYVDGPDLGRWLLDARPSPQEAESLFLGVLDGVEAAHGAGLVHRDLKPGNILLAREGGGLVPKITDFGLVKVLCTDKARARTRVGAMMGTPSYMAPEQFRDASSVDHRVDIFALGAILYEMLACAPAYEGEDLIDLFERISAQDRKPLPDHVPARLRATVEACLRPDREQRPSSCARIRRLLQRSPPPTQPPPSPTGGETLDEILLSGPDIEAEAEAPPTQPQPPPQPQARPRAQQTSGAPVWLALLGGVFAAVLLVSLFSVLILTWLVGTAGLLDAGLLDTGF